MQYSVTHPVGARITGLRVDALDPLQASEIRMVLAICGVIVIPHQHDLDDDAFERFLHSFGELTFTVGETPVRGHEDLNVISNIGRTSTPRSAFHVDTSYVRRPPLFTALRAITVPAHGGHTLFSNQYAAYDTLPAHMKTLLRGRRVTHVVTGVTLDSSAETSAEHLLVQRHPLSGRLALYLSTPQRCVAISGMSQADSSRTIAFLHEHCTREANVLRHRWSAGDVVMWDNRCVMHRADHSSVLGDRVMHRGMVAATP